MYTTSKESATLKLYHEILKDSTLPNTEIFSLKTLFPETKPYIILGTTYYKPYYVESSTHNMYYIHDENKKYFGKELYLYFCADCYTDCGVLKLKYSKEVNNFISFAKKDFRPASPSNDLIIRDQDKKHEMEENFNTSPGKKRKLLLIQNQ